MSVCSTASSATCSWMGEEVPLEQAIDSCFTQLQDRLNQMQCATRSLAMLSECDDDFKAAVEFDDSIADNVDGIIELMKELKQVSAGVRGKAPADEKAWYAQHQAQRKAEKQRIKDEVKAQKLAEKMAMSSISEEKKG